LTHLADDREYFPPYDATPVVRTPTLRRVAMLEPAIRGLAGAITADDMRRMNHEVDGLRRDARAVAAAFLASDARKLRRSR
jgi:osmoprotectant transport system substrate-binding protein